MEIEITTYTPKLGEAIESLQRRYVAANPKGTKFVPAETYLQLPALEEGRNVLCAMVPGQLAGYGALLPQPADSDGPSDLANMIWIHIRVDPERENGAQIQEILFEHIQDKATVYARGWKKRSTKIAVSYPESRSEEIAFFAGKKLQRFDALLQMSRDLSPLVPDLPIPDGVTIHCWGMETSQEKQQYIAAAAVAFPQAPQTIETIEFFMQSWEGGIPLIARDRRGTIAGGLMAFWYGSRNGVTEDIFVLPPWRRKGIARYLIAEGIRFLFGHDVEIARLEVKKSNTPAVQLYQSMGYEITNREEQWAKTI